MIENCSLYMGISLIIYENNFYLLAYLPMPLLPPLASRPAPSSLPPSAFFLFISFFVTFIPFFIFVHTFKSKQLIQCDSREENKMNKSLVRKGIVIGIIVLFIGGVVPNVCGNSGVISVKDKEMVFGNVFTRGAPEVWVDDDYYDGGYNDGHTWGYDAFDNIQDGVDNVLEDGRVNVKDGLYDVFQVEGRTNLIIIGEGQPIVTGNQLVYDTSYPEYVNNVVFVNNSQYIYLVGFEILGTNPTSPVRDFSVFYQNSHGANELRKNRHLCKNWNYSKRS